MQDLLNALFASEEIISFVAAHLQKIADRLAPIGHLQHLAGEAQAGAGFTRDPDIGQEVHLYAPLPGPFTDRAAAALDVEAEVAWSKAPLLGFGQVGEDISDDVVNACVGGRRGGRAGPDGRLVHANDLVHLGYAFDTVVGAGRLLGEVLELGQGLAQNVFHQRAFAGAGDAGDDGERAQRETHVQALEVQVAGVAHGEGLAIGRAAVGGHGYGRCAGQIFAGQRVRVVLHLGGRALGHYLAAFGARAWAEIDQMVGRFQHLAVVFHHHQGVAQVAQPLHGTQQAGVVARVQADGWFVQNVEHAGQAGADLPGQADALTFTA